MAEKVRAVLIAGPTASGKSGLALDLAETFGGVVINADSMQVYRELRILTARPSPEEEARAPHRLYGFRPAAEPYSVALWLEDAARVLSEAEEEGLLPIIVGGTGLYFHALTEGLSNIPAIPEDVRAYWRAEGEAHPAEKLHASLAQRDPQTAAALRPSDTQRIVRALEVLDATGMPLAEWQIRRTPPLLPASQTLRIVLELDRAELYARCDARFDWMMQAGALEEAAHIAELGLAAALPVMRAVGLPPLLAHLRGEMSLAEAETIAKTDTRRYAKRQMTWIRSKMISWNRYYAQQIERTKREIHILLQRCLTVPS